MQRMVVGRVIELSVCGTGTLACAGLHSHPVARRIGAQTGVSVPRSRGLYMGLACGEEELQEWAYALGPGGFIVLGALDALVMQVEVELPAFFEQHVAEAFDVVDNAWAFIRSDIEPDTR